MNYVFVDESGDPGKPYKIEGDKKIATGASLFYCLTALPLTSEEVFLLENRVTEVKNKFKYKKEIKGDYIPLVLYKALLNIINEQKIKVHFRLINKETYKGTFAVDGNKKLHNVFDEYNLVKVVSFAINKRNFTNTEVVIDRAERRMLDGKFDNFNNYLIKKINTKTIRKVSFVTHASSEYVYILQMSDLISGAIKDFFTKKNPELKKVIDKKLLYKIW